MSTYSLELLDSDKYLEEFEENILNSFDAFYKREYFRIGDGVEDINRLKHDLVFYRILQEDNCDIVNYIQDKIEGKLENCNKKKKRKRISESLEDFQRENNCEQNEALQEIFWTNVEW